MPYNRIFVTGGAGYIGSHVVAELLSQGHAVFSIDSFQNSRPEVYDLIRRVTGRQVYSAAVDLRQASELEEIMRRFRPDAVIHLAGLKSVDASTRDPLGYYDCNVHGSLVLLQAMKAAGISRIVFSSSASVYGDARCLPVDEMHPTQPQSPYGRTKLHIEEILKDLATSDAGFSAAILRYFNPVGCHPSGMIGEWPTTRPSNLMPVVAQVAAGIRPRLIIYGNDYDTEDGTGIRDYIHVTDLALAHINALEWTAQKTGARAFNLGVGQGISVRKIVRTFEEVTGRDIPFAYAPRRPGDVATSVSDPTRAFAEIGWRAAYGPRDMCSSVWKWQQQISGIKVSA